MRGPDGTERQQTWYETLAHTPGVSATSFGPSASRPVLRGFQGERVSVLSDGIGAIDSDMARISFTSPTKPAVVTGKSDGDPDYRYVLMPIRSAG